MHSTNNSAMPQGSNENQKSSCHQRAYSWCTIKYESCFPQSGRKATRNKPRLLHRWAFKSQLYRWNQTQAPEPNSENSASWVPLCLLVCGWMCLLYLKYVLKFFTTIINPVISDNTKVWDMFKVLIKRHTIMIETKGEFIKHSWVVKNIFPFFFLHMEWRFERTLKGKGYIGLRGTKANLSLLQPSSDNEPEQREKIFQSFFHFECTTRWLAPKVETCPMFAQEATKLFQGRKAEHSQGCALWASCRSRGEEWTWTPRATERLPRAAKRPWRSHLPQEIFNVDKAAPL